MSSDERAMLKEKILSKVQITSPYYREDAELVSLFQNWEPQKLFFHERLLHYRQFCMAILKLLWHRNVPVQLRPAEVCKELRRPLLGVEYVVDLRTPPSSLAQPKELQPSCHFRRVDYFSKSSYSFSDNHPILTVFWYRTVAQFWVCIPICRLWSDVQQRRKV